MFPVSLVQNFKSSYGFVHYFDRRSAALAILSLNGRHLFGQPIKVNWAYATGHYIFVGDLSPEVTDATLFACFSVYPSCSDARVMWDQKTGRSRGFGFVSFCSQQEAQSAINDLSGKRLGSRQIRCNWATKGATGKDDKQSSDAESVVELTHGSSGMYTYYLVMQRMVLRQPIVKAPGNNPQYTTVTQHELHRHFHALGAGVIEEVRVQREKGFGFVRYSTHGEAALAIQMGIMFIESLTHKYPEMSHSASRVSNRGRSRVFGHFGFTVIAAVAGAIGAIAGVAGNSDGDETTISRS
ncbi:Oligouridylate-binding protein 1B [Hibiscus syriacus]|uniref:Oligouridylate-binding protein 1B n=1 Tax=Hibiscus syriacus TaxID=106335 RepID=A0A6A2ZXT1_HIBSY|nr:Oligouridylate-binding protein 1B [Hibiscus syriacus]